MAHVMIDIETMGTRTDTVVLTIGALRFDPHVVGDSQEELYLHPDLDQQLTVLGRTTDEATLDWWGKQAAEVRAEAFREDGRIAIEDALAKLSEFCKGASGVWAQGPQFDLSILENMYASVGMKAPWRYGKVRDSRTLLSMLGDGRDHGRAGAHNALDDCREQARAIQECMARVPTSREVELIPVEDALAELSDFVNAADGLWAQGLLFDLSILENMYASAGMKAPWRAHGARSIAGG